MADYNLGPYRLKFRGDYDGTTEYRYLDVVRYNGGSYTCKNLDTIDGVSCIGVAPTGMPNSELYWEPSALPGEKGDPADYYRPFKTIIDGHWDFSEADKIFIPDSATENRLEITNAEDGCCGLIITRKDLELPSNSYKSADFGYIELVTGEDYFIYTFTYTDIGTGGKCFFWHRSVVTKVS